MSERFQQILSAARIAEMTALGVWQNRLACDLLDDAAAASPEAVAIVEHRAATGRCDRITYAELQTRSRRIAAGLAAHGIGRGDVVAVQLPNWWHYAAVYTACVRIGAVMNPLMPIFRERELAFMLGFGAAKAWIVPREFRGHDYVAMAASLRPELPSLEHVFTVEGTDPSTAFEQCLAEHPLLPAA